MRVKIIPQFDEAGNKLEYFKPLRAHDNDAGADIRTPISFALPAATIREATEAEKNDPDFVEKHISKEDGLAHIPGHIRVNTNFGLDLPDGTMAICAPKSGQCAKGVFAQIPPVDSGYNGNIGVYLYNSTPDTILYNEGDKIAQIVIIPVLLPDFDENYDKFERGSGKEGSTGK